MRSFPYFLAYFFGFLFAAKAIWLGWQAWRGRKAFRERKHDDDDDKNDPVGGWGTPLG